MARTLPDRRTFLGLLAASGVIGAMPVLAQPSTTLKRPIPSTGETLPVIGLGSWQTFNVGEDQVLRDSCADVMKAFFDLGGTMIDSSPMYGSSQPVIGYGLEKLGKTRAVFSADKVWISSGDEGPAQIEQSRQYWRVPYFHLMQVHNLRSWEAHLATLQQMKEAKRLRYVGISTSHGRRHDDMERIMRDHDLDFIQVTYNILDREVEQRLLPLAREKGIAVIANRPFRQGDLIDAVQRHRLPEWAGEVDCANWAQFLLKFVVSHPAMTCAIPATSRVDHLRENMGAARGRLPDEAMRKRMADYVGQL